MKKTVLLIIAAVVVAGGVVAGLVGRHNGNGRAASGYDGNSGFHHEKSDRCPAGTECGTAVFAGGG